MRKFEVLKMGRKAESIYTAAKKNRVAAGKKCNICQMHRIDTSFEEQMQKNAMPKACYVYINGVIMPVLSA